MNKSFMFFYLLGLFLTGFIIYLKICYPDLDSMFLLSLAGMVIVPSIKEAFNRLKTEKLIKTLEKKTGNLERGPGTGPGNQVID